MVNKESFLAQPHTNEYGFASTIGSRGEFSPTSTRRAVREVNRGGKQAGTCRSIPTTVPEQPSEGCESAAAAAAYWTGHSWSGFIFFISY